jgi:CO/xanthine dehydrogenase Mo-binding subunit
VATSLDSTATGSALYEELKFDEDGSVINPNLINYYVPHFEDMTASIESYIIETPQKDGPLGARGVGEHVMIGVAPAIANAILRTTGVKINQLPITAEKLWKAIKEQKPELIEKAQKLFFEEGIKEVQQV